MALRTRLKSISIKAFKSFGPKSQQFCVDKGITLIVGPNGSGKSNVLDALRFALGCNPAELRVKSFSELQNAGTKEPAHVVLLFESLQRSYSTTSSECQCIEAKLLLDGSRQTRINGRLKQQSELKDFLRHIGVFLDFSSAMQQSVITLLADKNNGKQIAHFISCVSGAETWREEVEKASCIIQKTTSSLAGIDHNIDILKQATDEDAKNIQALEDLKEAEISAKEMQQSILVYARREAKLASALLEESSTALNDDVNHAKFVSSSLSHEQENHIATVAASRALKNELEELQQAHLHMLQNLAEVEEKLSLLEQKGETGHTQSELVELKLAAVELSRQQSHLTGLLEEEEAVFSTILPVCNGPSKDILSSLRRQLEETDMEVLNFEKHVHEVRLKVSISERQLEGLADKSMTLKRELEAVDAQGTRDNIEDDIANTRTELAVCTRAMKQLVSQLPLSNDTLDSFSAIPLHQCFRLHKVEPFLRALSVIAGNAHSIYVVPTTRVARDLLEHWEKEGLKHGSNCRIWPLNSIIAENATLELRRVAAGFAEGQVVVPADLVKVVEDVFQPALWKLLGKTVIVQSDNIAARVAVQYGISAVTLSGTMHKWGSMTGGYNKDASHGNSSFCFLKAKSKLDCLRDQHSVLKQKLLDLEKLEQGSQHMKRLLQQLRRMEIQTISILTELNKRKMEAEDHESSLKLKTRRSFILQHWIDRLVSIPEKEGDLTPAIRLLVAERETALQHCMHTLAATEAKHDLLQRILSSSHGELQEETSKEILENERDRLKCELSSVSNSLQETRKRVDVQEQAQKHSEAKLESLKAAVDTATSMVKQREGIVNDMAQRLKARQQDLQMLEKDFGACDSDGKAITISSLTDAKGTLSCLQKKISALRQKTTKLSDGERIAMLARRNQLQDFKDKQKSVETSLVILKDGMKKSQGMVEKIDLDVFHCVNAVFSRLCSQFLPEKHVQLKLQGDVVSDGILFEFSSVDHPQQNGSWTTNLGQLSGGQRTLICLAFVLSIVQGCQSSLYLVDEVDAALDEIKQQQVAALIKQELASGQVICVSHQSSFQQMANALLQTHMSKTGTVVQMLEK